MLTIEYVARLAERYHIPLEDVLFIALNINGVNLECDYNRMRMAFRLTDSKLFEYAKQRGVPPHGTVARRNELDFFRNFC